MAENRQRVVWIVAMVAIVAAIAVAAFMASTPEDKPERPLVALTIAVTTNPDSALVHVAQLKGFFEDEGLVVTPVTFTSGKASLEAVLRGEAQIATVAETPIVLNILKGAPLVVIAGIFHSDRNMGVVARRDHGIATPQDLSGKTVATPLGTNAQYFFSAFSAVEGIPDSAIELIGMPPEATVDALASGQVDAVAVWNPVLLALQHKLGDKGVLFYGEHVYTYTFNLAATGEFSAANPQTLSALLKALLRAEAAMRDDPAEARRVVTAFSGWDSALLAELWNDYSFRLELDQALLVSMENQARWALETGQAPARKPPNFLDAIYLEAMQMVAPERITIAH